MIISIHNVFPSFSDGQNPCIISDYLVFRINSLPCEVHACVRACRRACVHALLRGKYSHMECRFTLFRVLLAGKDSLLCIKEVIKMYGVKITHGNMDFSYRICPIFCSVSKRPIYQPFGTLGAPLRAPKKL